MKSFVTPSLCLAVLALVAACDRAGEPEIVAANEPASNAEAPSSQVLEEVSAEEIPEYTIEEFLETVAHGGLSFSPDNSKILVHSNETGIFNLYALSTDGAEREQLTHCSLIVALTVDRAASEKAARDRQIDVDVIEGSPHPRDLIVYGG